MVRARHERQAFLPRLEEIIVVGRLDPVQTRQLEAAHPLGAGRPEDVARAAAFLLAPENRWITGTDLVVDGGYTAR